MDKRDDGLPAWWSGWKFLRSLFTDCDFSLTASVVRWMYRLASWGITSCLLRILAGVAPNHFFSLEGLLLL